MVDASILIPTHRHALLLPYALASALDQEGVDVEVLVVGDGVEDPTREVVARYVDDPRVRYFDFPKGPSKGEVHRHAALREATGRIIAYVSDDDVLLRDHVRTMLELLQEADFAHSATAWLDPSGTMSFHPWNVADRTFTEVMRTGPNAIGLTSASHTLEAYRRLPHGWRTTPAGEPTDRHMWLQWLEQPWFRGISSRRLTHLQFPSMLWAAMPEVERAEALAAWFERSRVPGFRDEVDASFADAVVRGGEKYRIQAWSSAQQLAAITATRTWRLRQRLRRARR